MRSFAVLVITLAAAFVSTAQTVEVENWCRAGFFTSETDNFRLAVATGKSGDRIYFYNDFEDDCPGKESCRAKAYVVPGDRLIVSRTYKDFGCVWFTPGKGVPTIGWIKLADLKFANAVTTKPALSSWLGEWNYADNHIKFTHNKLAGYLNAAGDALWRGVGDNVHVGELDDRVQPVGNVVKVGESDTDEYSCKATMRLIADFLVVNDNGNCGGANVTFSGVYRRTRRY